MSLTVSSAIPYGNVALAEVNEVDGKNEVRFTADAHGGLERLWFCFRIVNNGEKSSYRQTKLVLKHYDTMLGGGISSGTAETLTPVIRYADRQWERLSGTKLHVLADGTVELSWIIETPERYVDIAACYPYGPPEIEQLLQDCHNYWEMTEMGVSQGGNPMWRLSNMFGSESNRQRGIYITARQHSAEVAGSWVLDGLLRRIAELSIKDICIWCVPFANIDGVLNGDYGKNPFPHDLNRAWTPSPMRHEVRAIMADLRRWKLRCNPLAFFDFHSPGYCEKTGLYAFPQKNDLILEYLNKIRNKLGKYAASDFNLKQTHKARSVWGQFPTACEHLQQEHQIPAASIECSYMQNEAGEILTIDDYREAGVLFADGLLQLQ